MSTFKSIPLETCVPLPNFTDEYINIYMHVLILFCFLTLFYIFVISKIETNLMTTEINSQISNGLNNSINNLTPNESRNFKMLKVLPFDALKREYSKPDQSYTIYNTWLFRTAYIINGMLFFGFILSILLLTYSCGNCTNLKNIILHNAIVFTLVGGVEYMFFTHIASKFVPTKPSLMINVFFQNLNTLFGSSQ